jgi:hypothetical protein
MMIFTLLLLFMRGCWSFYLDPPLSSAIERLFYDSRIKERIFTSHHNQINKINFQLVPPTLAHDAKISELAALQSSTGHDIAVFSKPNVMIPIGSLIVTCILWGSYGIGMKYLYITSSPPELLFNLVAAGFSSAALTAACNVKMITGIQKIHEPTQDRKHIFSFSPARLAGLELGAYLVLASTFQLFGLGLTSTSHSAFIIQLATVFAPLFQAIANRALPSIISCISCTLAFIGVVFLTLPTASAISVSGDVVYSASKSILLGDILSLIAAAIYGIHVVRLGVHAPKIEPIILANMKEQSRFLISALFSKWSDLCYFRNTIPF